MMYPARLKSIYKFVMKLLGTCYTRGNDAQASCRDDLLSVFQLAIPIFHCYGHKLKCQVCTLYVSQKIHYHFQPVLFNGLKRWWI